MAPRHVSCMLEWEGTNLSLEYAVASQGVSLRTLYSSPPATQHPLGDIEGC